MSAITPPFPFLIPPHNTPSYMLTRPWGAFRIRRGVHVSPGQSKCVLRAIRWQVWVSRVSGMAFLPLSPQPWTRPNTREVSGRVDISKPVLPVIISRTFPIRILSTTQFPCCSACYGDSPHNRKIYVEHYSTSMLQCSRFFHILSGSLAGRLAGGSMRSDVASGTSGL